MRLLLYGRCVLQLGLLTLPLLFSPGRLFIAKNSLNPGPLRVIPDLIGNPVNKNPITPAVQLKNEQHRLKAERTEKLTAFLQKRQSPLAPEAEAFINVAMEKDLDWRLLPAIACKESGCGVAIPYNYQAGQPSYNPFGWGVFDNEALTFPNWKSAIEEVAEGL